MHLTTQNDNINPVLSDTLNNSGDDTITNIDDNESIIDEEYLHLPEEVGATLSDPAFDGYCDELAERYHVNENLRGGVALATELVMTGELPPKNYVEALMAALDIPQERAARIAQEVNNAIFNPIKDALLKVHAVSTLSPAMQAVAAQAMPGSIGPQSLIPSSEQIQQPVPISAPTTFPPEPAPTSTTRPAASVPVTPALEPSPRAVATPPSTMAAKLGNTYKVDPGVPQYGLSRSSESEVPRPRQNTSAPQAKYYPPAAMRPSPTQPPAPQSVRPPQQAKYYPPATGTGGGTPQIFDASTNTLEPTPQASRPRPAASMPTTPSTRPTQQYPSSAARGSDLYREPPTTADDSRFGDPQVPPPGSGEMRGPNRFSV